MTTCARPKCPNRPHRYDLCEKHYLISPHGYVPRDAIAGHIRALRDKGYGLEALSELTGLSKEVFSYTESGRRHDVSHRRTADAILSVPIPAKVVDKGGLVPAFGAARRIRALCRIGHTQTFIAEHFDARLQMVNKILTQPYLTARWHVRIAGLYDELHLIDGPSRVMRSRARTYGWLPPLAWEDIDDPDEVPDTGSEERVPLLERVEEYRELGRSEEQIAKALGMKVASLKVAISREKRRAAA